MLGWKSKMGYQLQKIEVIPLERLGANHWGFMGFLNESLPKTPWAFWGEDLGHKCPADHQIMAENKASRLPSQKAIEKNMKKQNSELARNDIPLISHWYPFPSRVIFPYLQTYVIFFPWSYICNICRQFLVQPRYAGVHAWGANHPWHRSDSGKDVGVQWHVASMCTYFLSIDWKWWHVRHGQSQVEIRKY